MHTCSKHASLRSCLESLPFLVPFLSLLLSLSICCALSVSVSAQSSCDGNSYVQVITSAECDDATSIIIDPLTGAVILGCSNTGIFSISPDYSSNITLLANVSACGMPRSVFEDLESQLIIGACLDGDVVSINRTSGVVRSILPQSVLDNCSAITYALQDSRSRAYYISCLGTKRTAVMKVEGINAATLAMMDANFLLRDSINDVLYLASDSGLYSIDANLTLRTLADATRCANAAALYRDDATGVLYAACEWTGVLAITANDPSNVTTFIPASICQGAQTIVKSSLMNVLFIACSTNGVIALHLETLALANLFDPTAMQIGTVISVAEDSKRDVVYTLSSDKLVAIHGSTISLVATVQLCVDAAFQYLENEFIQIYSCGFSGLLMVNGSTASTLVSADICFPGNVNMDVNGLIFLPCQLTPDFLPPAILLVDATSRSVTTLLNFTDCLHPGRVIKSDSSSTNMNQLWTICSNNLTLLSFPNGYGSKPSIATIDIPSCDVHDIFHDALTRTLYVGCSITSGLPDSIGLLAMQGLQRVVVTIQSQCAPRRQTFAQDVTTGLNYFICEDDSLLIVNGTRIVSHQPVPGCTNAASVYVYSNLLQLSCSEGVIQVDLRSSSSVVFLTQHQCRIPTHAHTDQTTQLTYVLCKATSIIKVATQFRCPPGSEWLMGSCSACAPHFYRPANDLTSFSKCRSCAPGFIAPLSGSASCSPCLPGSYEMNNQCLFCASGKYQPQSNATACFDCSPGMYAIQPGSSNCTLCEAGFYSSINGSVSCQPCNSGSASNTTGRTHACDGCLPGYYQGAPGKTECEPCEPHFYSEQTHSTSCTRCKNQVNIERTTCNVTVCEANYEFSDETNTCELCALGWSSGRGVNKCSVCVVNTYTPARGADCVSCEQPGMNGLACAGGLASVKKDYWAFLSAEVESGQSADSPSSSMYPLYQTVPCPFGLCPGSQLQVALVNSSTSNSTATQSMIVYCEFPRLNSASNVFCGQCELGFIPWGSSCIRCEGVNVGLWFAGLFLSLTLVLFLYQSSSTSSAGSTSIFLLFIQTAALEIGSNMKYIDWIQFINLDTKSTSSCLAPWSTYDQTLFSLFMPVILLAELTVLGLIHFLLHQIVTNHACCSKADSSNLIITQLRRPFSVTHYRRAAIAILLFCYTQVANTAVRYLYCVDVGSSRVNFSSPDMDCDSSTYKRYLAPVILALIIYVIAFPLVSFVILWRRRESLFLISNSDTATGLNPSIASFLHRWSPMYKMYKPNAYFWQCWVLLRRAAFVLVSVLLIQQTAIRYMAFIFLHFGSFLLHLIVEPYESKILNFNETAAYACLICISALLCANLPPYSTGVQIMLFLFIVPTAIALIGHIIHQQIGEFRMWLNSRKLQKKQDSSETPSQIGTVQEMCTTGTDSSQSDAALASNLVMPSVTPSDLYLDNQTDASVFSN